MANLTRRRRTRFTAEQRRTQVGQFARSGLSQAEFCRRSGLHPATFSLWRRRAEAPAPGFAEVAITPPVLLAGTVAILHLPGSVRLEVSALDETAWRGLGLLLRSLAP